MKEWRDAGMGYPERLRMPLPWRCLGQVGWGPDQSDLVLNLAAGNSACAEGWKLVMLEVSSSSSHFMIIFL